MTSIQLNSLMLLPDDERLKMTFSQFIYKFFWFFQPISKNDNKDESSPSSSLMSSKQVIWEVVRDLGLAGIKVFLCDWARDSIVLSTSAIDRGGASLRKDVLKNYSTIVQLSAMFGFFMFARTTMDDINNALVTLFTWGRYKRLSFNDWPILSASPREFWGRSYNRPLSTFLRESVFQPLRLQAGFSADAAAMTCFALSAGLHMHTVKLCFGGGVWSTMMYFFIHGIACGIESRYSEVWNSLPKLIRISLTQGFLLATTPLYLALFIYACPAWLIGHPPNITLPDSLKFWPAPDYSPYYMFIHEKSM